MANAVPPAKFSYELTVERADGSVVGSTTVTDDFGLEEYGNRVRFGNVGDYGGDGDHGYVDHVRYGSGATIEDWEERELTDYTQTETASDGGGGASLVSAPTASGSHALELYTGQTWNRYTSNEDLVDIRPGVAIEGAIRHETDNSGTYAMRTGFSVGTTAEGESGIQVHLINEGSQRTPGVRITTPNDSGHVSFTPELGAFYTVRIEIGSGSQRKCSEFGFYDDFGHGEYSTDPAWQTYLSQGDFEAAFVDVDAPGVGGDSALDVTETTGGGTDGIVGWAEPMSGWNDAWTLSGLFQATTVNTEAEFQQHAVGGYYDPESDMDTPGVQARLGFTDGSGDVVPFRIDGTLVTSIETTYDPGWSEGTWYRYELSHDGKGTYTGRLWEAGTERPAEPNARSVGEVPGTDERVGAIRINGAPASGGGDDFHMRHAELGWCPADRPASSQSTSWVLKRHHVDSLEDADGIDVADLTDSERTNLVTGNGENGEAHVWEWDETTGTWSSTKIYSGGGEIEGVLTHDLDGDGVPEVYLMDQGKGNVVVVVRSDDAGEEWEDEVLDGSVKAAQTGRVYERPGEEPSKALYVAYEGGDGQDKGGVKRYWPTDRLESAQDPGATLDPDAWNRERIVEHPGAWGLSIEQRDIDGDGTLEFLLGARGSKNDYHDNGLYYVPSGSGGGDWNWTPEIIDRDEGGERGLPPGRPIGYSHVYFGDMTGDGVRDDIVACGWPGQDKGAYWFESEDRFGDDFTHHQVGLDDKYWNAKPIDVGQDRDAVLLCHRSGGDHALELWVYDDTAGDWTRRSGQPTSKADDQLPSVEFGDGAANFASVSAKSNDLDWWEVTRAGAGEPAIFAKNRSIPVSAPDIPDVFGDGAEETDSSDEARLELTAVGFPHTTDENTYEWEVFESVARETRVATGTGERTTVTVPDGSYFVTVRAEHEGDEPVTAHRTVDATPIPAPVAYDAAVLDGDSFDGYGFNVFRSDGRITVRTTGAGWEKADYQFDVWATGGTIQDVETESWNSKESLDTSAQRIEGDGRIGSKGGYDQFSFTSDADALAFDLQFDPDLGSDYGDGDGLDYVHLGEDGQIPALSPVRIEFGLGPDDGVEELANGSTVRDLNGDGEYRDVTGDGSVTNTDVTEFFANQHADPWNTRTDLFDFTGDGEVTQADVIDLFEYLASGSS